VEATPLAPLKGELAPEVPEGLLLRFAQQENRTVTRYLFRFGANLRQGAEVRHEINKIQQFDISIQGEFE
jgi:hypothetical protein